jgi:hypothetical protein
MSGAETAEARLDGFEHHVADVGTADPGVRNGAPGDDLAVMGVEGEGAADDLAVPAGELETVRAPSEVGAHRRRSGSPR